MKFPIPSLSLLFFSGLFVWLAPTPLKAEGLSISKTPETFTLSFGGRAETVAPQEVSLWFRSVPTTLYRAGTETEALDPNVCPLPLFVCEFSLPVETLYGISGATTVSLDIPALRNFLERLREQTRALPINAVFSVGESGAVTAFAPSRDGMEIDIEKSLEAIEIALRKGMVGTQENPLPLPERILRPDIAETDADRLGIVSFLGEGRTNFAGSPKNRVFNIKRAIEQFQGILIAPGEEFSFVKYLGEVDGEHGYLPELVIKRGRTEPEFGGGICQVSTTFFRAALNTGQKITERRNHAYPVQYYRPYGMDATIYIPKPDFRFRNETPAHILVQIAIEKSELIIRFYGTSDGRTASIDGPHITGRTPDGGMKTSFTQKVLARDGSTLFEDTFKSAYESPSKYPHPGDEKLTQKPNNWSEKQWDAYVKTGALPR